MNLGTLSFSAKTLANGVINVPATFTFTAGIRLRVGGPRSLSRSKMERWSSRQRRHFLGQEENILRKTGVGDIDPTVGFIL